MIWAAGFRLPDIVHLLLDTGADVNGMDEVDDTLMSVGARVSLDTGQASGLRSALDPPSRRVVT